MKWSVVLIWDDVSFFLHIDELHYMCFPNIKSWVGYDSVPHSPLKCITGQGELSWWAQRWYFHLNSLYKDLIISAAFMPTLTSGHLMYFLHRNVFELSHMQIKNQKDASLFRTLIYYQEVWNHLTTVLFWDVWLTNSKELGLVRSI